MRDDVMSSGRLYLIQRISGSISGLGMQPMQAQPRFIGHQARKKR